MQDPEFVTMQHYFVTPYYAYVRFGMWDEALAAPAPADALLYPRAMRHFMRGMAFAAKGQSEDAQQELTRLRPLAENEALEQVTVWGINSALALAGIAAELLEGEIAVRQGNYETGLPHLQRAVELQKSLNYDEPPDWPFPLRHYLGAALLEAGRPRDAERIYREDLEEYPNNGWSLFGLARSLETMGRTREATEAESRFREVWSDADVGLRSSRDVIFPREQSEASGAQPGSAPEPQSPRQL